MIAVVALVSVRCAPRESTEAIAERLIRGAFATSRPTGGRLFGFPYAQPASQNTTSEGLDQAGLLLATLRPDSVATNRLKTYIDIVRARWKKAAEQLRWQVSAYPDDPGFLNDLGVVYMEIGRRDAVYMFEALSLFEAASKVAPTAAEPAFNLVLTYRQLNQEQKAAAALDSYRTLDPAMDSVRELAAHQPRAERIAGDIRNLKKALSEGEARSAWITAEQNPDAWSQVLLEMTMGGNSFQGDGSAVHEVADRFAERFGDETGPAILLPLGSGHNDRVLAARKAVVEARSEYRARRYRESLRVLDHAANLLEGSDSEFDRLWIEIARADALIWDRQLDAARMILQSVVDSSRRNNFKWLLGRALTVYGTDYRLSGSRPDMIEHLEEALEVYESIGARGESTRARFYLANYLRFEGRTTDSLNMAHQALEVVPPNDHGRHYQLLWITGSNLALRGDPKQAAAYYVEAAVRAELANDPVGSAQINIELAEIYENDSRSDLADQHIQRAEASLGKRQSTDLVASLIDVIVTLGKSRILEGRGKSDEALNLLVEKLPLLDRESIETVYSHQYRSAMAETLLGAGRKEGARKQFDLAVRAVDREDDMFTSTARLAFDPRRRRVYESAIGFEFDEGNLEQAWEYAQRYRARLLEEMLGQYAPEHEGFADRVAAMSDRRAALGDTHLLEYTVLKDRLLVWLVSGTALEGYAYPIKRAALEESVGRFLAMVRTGTPADELAETSVELYQALIGPVSGLLQNTVSFAIVPDRILHRLPFGALRSPEGEYLLEEHPLVQTPNLAYFLSPESPRVNDPKQIAMGSRDLDVSIGQELEGLEESYDGLTSYNGFDVDRTLFLEALNGASLFHYAGHSAVDGTNAFRSSILLEGDDEGPNVISAADIASSRLAPDALVVLSSCDSSVGNSIGGAGVRGLTSAFLIAGAGAVVGSLWPVETVATKELMLRFHRNRAGGRSVVDALREAQLSFIQDFPEQAHPYYWSGFTVTGNRSALRSGVPAGAGS